MVFSEKEEGVIYFEDDQTWSITGYGLLGGDMLGQANIGQGVCSTADGFGNEKGYGFGHGSGEGVISFEY